MKRISCLSRAAVIATVAASLLMSATLVSAHSATFWFGHVGKAAEVGRTIEMSATDIRFTPKTVTVAVGETVKFQVTNSGKLDHEFLLGDAGDQVEHDKEMLTMGGMKIAHVNGVSIAAGQTASLVWTFTKSGTLQYACHVPGHYLAGMVGQLTIK